MIDNTLIHAKDLIVGALSGVPEGMNTRELGEATGLTNNLSVLLDARSALVREGVVIKDSLSPFSKARLA